MHDRFRLDGFAPYSPQSQELADDLLLSTDTHHAPATHHGPDGRHIHLLTYDRAMIWSSDPGADPCGLRTEAACSRSAAALNRAEVAPPTTLAETSAAATPSSRPRPNARSAP